MQESEMILEWTAEQVTEITTTAFEFGFLSSETNVKRWVQNREIVLRKMHTTHMDPTSYEQTTRLSSTQEESAGDLTETEEALLSDDGRREVEKRYFLRTIISSGRRSLVELQAAIERWEFYVSVSEEVEKHLIPNSNRLRIFEDAHWVIVTYVETKFGLRIRDSKRRDTGSGGHWDRTDVMRSTLSRLAQEKGENLNVMGVSGGAHFQRDCNASKKVDN